MYVCMYALHACILIRIYIHTFMHIDTYTHTYVHTYTHKCMHAPRIHECIHKHTHVLCMHTNHNFIECLDCPSIYNQSNTVTWRKETRSWRLTEYQSRIKTNQRWVGIFNIHHVHLQITRACLHVPDLLTRVAI